MLFNLPLTCKDCYQNALGIKSEGASVNSYEQRTFDLHVICK